MKSGRDPDVASILTRGIKMIENISKALEANAIWKLQIQGPISPSSLLCTEIRDLVNDGLMNVKSWFSLHRGDFHRFDTTTWILVAVMLELAPNCLMRRNPAFNIWRLEIRHLLWNLALTDR